MINACVAERLSHVPDLILNRNTQWAIAGHDGCTVIKALSWMIVKHLLSACTLSRCDLPEVTAFGEPVTPQTVDILVSITLPGSVRIRGVNLQPPFRFEVYEAGELRTIAGC